MAAKAQHASSEIAGAGRNTATLPDLWNAAAALHRRAREFARFCRFGHGLRPLGAKLAS